MSSNTQKSLAVLALGAVIWFSPVPAGLKQEAWHLFAVFAATILGFILQPFPIGAIAFSAITFTILSGLLKPEQALSGFGNDSIWLIVSAFLFAKGFIKAGLGRRIAYMIIKAIGDSTLKLGYAIVLSDFVMSPAMPSAAARAGGVLYPIVRGLCTALGSEPGPTSGKVGRFLMQTEYNGNAITCAMFLTAMAGNPLIALLASKTLHIEITWGQWAMAALVPGIASLIIIPYFIYKFDPPELLQLPLAKEMARQELQQMGPFSREEKIMSGVFIGALLLWSTSQFTKIDATVVAMFGVVIMLFTHVLDWKDILEEKGAWDTMIWMGSLIVIAGFLMTFGFIPWFANWVGASIVGIPWLPAFGLLLFVYLYSHYAFASLTAHITAMYAAFIAIAVAAGAPPYLVALALAFMSNLCMSLTHYGGSTAPIYFGSGYVSQGTWWKVGFMVSIVNLVIWVGLGSVWWKILGLW